MKSENGALLEFLERQQLTFKRFECQTTSSYEKNTKINPLIAYICMPTAEKQLYSSGLLGMSA